MSQNFNRRSFLSLATGGLGAAAFGSKITPLILNTKGIRSPGIKGKKLLATTDYTTNMGKWNSFYNRSQLDDLHKYLASMGVTRHQWIVDTYWNIYENYPNGMALLSEAVKSAHAHGIEFYAKIKSFEGGGFSDVLPHSFPFPEGAPAIMDIRGIYPLALPFVARNPHMSLKRRPGTYEAGGQITTIRLVKGSDASTRIRQKHLSVLTSNRNNDFIPYNGPMSFRETVEWRPCFPKSRNCRILHLEGLELPAGHKYILIRCELADNQGYFTNENGRIIELEDINGKIITYTLGTGPVAFRDIGGTLTEKIIRYYQLPEVQSEIKDQEKARKHYRDFYNFDVRRRITEPYTLDASGYIAIAAGKPEYMAGILHPVYPEVRQHWLDLIRYCLDRGADGVTFRASTHTQSSEFWEYGFNEPVIEAAGGRTDYPTIRRINGNAYTQLLSEARDLVKRRGKSITIQLYAQMLLPDDREGHLNWIPPNFEWHWKKWVNEIADELEFRGAWTLQPWNLKQVINTFSAVTRAANKPFYFEGKMQEIRDADFDGPFHYTSEEIDMVKNHPGLQGFSLYETNHFTRMDKDRRIEGSKGLKDLCDSLR